MRLKGRIGRCALALAGLCGALAPFSLAAQNLAPAPADLTRDQVLALETALAELNFDPGAIDGVIDERFRSAIRLYQDFAALPPDGVATPELVAEILSVAASFAEMRSNRVDETAAQAPATPEIAQSAPDTPMPAQPEPAGIEATGSEPSLPELSLEKALPDPRVQPIAPAPPETATAPRLAPVPAPAPEAKQRRPGTAGGFDIGDVLSRLAKPAVPSAAPQSAVRDEELARMPEAAPAPRPKPAPAADGYAAFRDAYEAAQQGDFQGAVERYDAAIGSKNLSLEHLGDAHFNRGNALYFLRRYDDSIADYNAAIGSKPTFAGAFYNRGFAYQAKGAAQRAVEDFRRARDLGLRRLGVRAPDRPPPLR